MRVPETPINELERLRELNEYSLLDTLPEEDYDNITQLASQICGTPIALITLIDKDRQWFKSSLGLAGTETPRNVSFCAHAILSPEEIMVVPDSREDDRFFDNPLVSGAPQVVFYAGIPLVTNKGFPLGALCVIDSVPHNISREQLKSLKALSTNVVRLFELRKSKMELEMVQTELQRKNQELERFASIAAHDLKSPLSNISSIVDLLKMAHSEHLSEEGQELIGLLDESSQQLRELIDGILEHSRSDALLQANREEVKLPQFFTDLLNLIDYKKQYQIKYPTDFNIITVNRHAIQQILINLIINGITYNDKDSVEISIGFEEGEMFYRFSVTDNGRGIAPEHQTKIFKLFERLDTPEQHETKGHGIGLSTVKKLVEHLGGEISIQSIVGQGTTFSFSVLK